MKEVAEVKDDKCSGKIVREKKTKERPWIEYFDKLMNVKNHEKSNSYMHGY